MREIIFDTETTGLSAAQGDRVIEIGALEYIDRFPTGKTFHEYINPGDREVHPDALAVHGISNEMLKDKPTFAEIADKFQAFFADGNLVAHNASFDIGFLNAEMSRLDLPAFDPDRVVDTLMIARRKHPAGPNSLDALCKRYGISNAHRTLHGALLDTELLAEVYLELTGGRQAGFDLSANLTSETENPALSGAIQKRAPARPRPTPLPERLSEQEIEAHRAFVETLGEDAVWQQWKTLH